MAKLIEFDLHGPVPKKVKPIPIEQRGKLVEFPKENFGAQSKTEAWFHSDSMASSIAIVESVFARLTMDTVHNTKLTKTCMVRGTIILLIVNSCSAENNDSAILATARATATSLQDRLG
jgi:hypothetical protein